MNTMFFFALSTDKTEISSRSTPRLGRHLELNGDPEIGKTNVTRLSKYTCRKQMQYGLRLSLSKVEYFESSPSCF